MQRLDNYTNLDTLRIVSRVVTVRRRLDGCQILVDYRPQRRPRRCARSAKDAVHGLLMGRRRNHSLQPVAEPWRASAPMDLHDVRPFATRLSSSLIRISSR
jgi:hypothetical protein